MSLSSGNIVSIILAILLGITIIFGSITLLYVYYCCVIRVKSDSNERYSVSDMKFEVDTHNQRKFIDSVYLKIITRPKPALDEEQAVSINTTTHPKSSSPPRLGLEISRDVVSNSHTVSDYASAAESFDKLTDGFFGPLNTKSPSKRFIRRMSSIQYKKDEGDLMKTIVAFPSESEQNYITSQYDSFSRTLMLQNLIQNSINHSECAIREVSDPFSDKTISIGGIVVVVKPFHGEDEFEFKLLETGDLLRIVKFYIKEEDETLELTKIQEVKSDEQKENSFSRKSTLSGSLASSSRARESSHRNSLTSNVSVDKESAVSGDRTLDGFTKDPFDLSLKKDDPKYNKIYCTGIILNSYLDYRDKNLTLKLKDAEENVAESEFLRDFPLRVISLETTLLNQLADTSSDE